MRLLWDTESHPKPLISTWQAAHLKEEAHKARVLTCPFSTYEISSFKEEMVAVMTVVWETPSLMNQNANIWKGKTNTSKIYIGAFMGLECFVPDLETI